MPLDLLAAYGAGVQIHVEDLAAYLAGRERVDAAGRWAELQPAYQVPVSITVLDSSLGRGVTIPAAVQVRAEGQETPNKT
jgi:hypothetical protein